MMPELHEVSKAGRRRAAAAFIGFLLASVPILHATLRGDPPLANNARQYSEIRRTTDVAGTVRGIVSVPSRLRFDSAVDRYLIELHGSGEFVTVADSIARPHRIGWTVALQRDEYHDGTTAYRF